MTKVPLLTLLLVPPAATASDQPAAPPVDCSEQPNWIFADRPGDWTQAPPLPWASSLLAQPVSASLFLAFAGNNTGPNSPELTAQLARFGHVGVGWQLTGSPANSHEGHLEVVEREMAAQLKAINPRVKVLALRNDEVVSPVWDCARALMLNPASKQLFLRDASGEPIAGDWFGTRSQPMLAGSLIQYWLNFSNAAARSWWADVFVGSALAEKNIDGALFDCACNPLEPAMRRARNAAAKPAVKQVLTAADKAQKLLMAYKPNGPTTACDKPQVSKQFCAEPMRYFMELGRNTSNISTMIMLHAYGGLGAAGQEINASVAAFLIARGSAGNSLLRLSSCVGCPYNWPTPPWTPAFELMPGLPLGDGVELSDGVFRREYERMTVELNCSSFVASFRAKVEVPVVAAAAARVLISNVEPRTTVEGATLPVHDGGVYRYGVGEQEGWYFYGMEYGECKENPKDGCTNHTTGACGFRTDHKVSIFRSPNLSQNSWTRVGSALPDGRPAAIYYRPKVLFNKATKKYVAVR